MKKEYLTLDRIEGSLLELSNLHRVSYGEVVKIISKDGKRSEIGQVIKIDEDRAVVQVFGNNLGAVSYTHLDVYKRQGY